MDVVERGEEEEQAVGVYLGTTFDGGTARRRLRTMSVAGTPTKYFLAGTLTSANNVRRLATAIVLLRRTRAFAGPCTCARRHRVPSLSG